ncbi:hypothetical protein FHL15_002290 [Xylaria flabelliformis]|uniref:Fungal N-terminal domain-containing protein n=1 Tax=Xylaria flabelliformis TaxID=2512241 RepID=A0A553I9V7_9PEZI|nr:hypothetical protein FHL15_002290 [Xylaria flabelliformis]
MDPVTALGAAGSVVGIIGFGFQLSQILCNYLSQVRSAQEHLEAVVDEIELTTSALQEIYGLLQQEVANIERGQPLYLFSGNSLENIRAIANRCLVIFWRVEATISGNWTTDDNSRLLEKLLEFNDKLKHSTPGSTIQIESELTADPLGSWDKFRWPSKASKLDKYCKQLQRYKYNLVLLLQIVSLGQQRLKPNPTEEDIRLMLKTYAIIHEVATPEELRTIAFATQKQSHSRHGNAGRDTSIAPSYIKQPQIPYQATAGNQRTPKFPIRSESYNFGTVRYRNNSQSQIVYMGAQSPKGFRSDVPLSPNRATINGHNNTSDVYAKDQLSSLPSISQAETSPVRLTNSDDITRHNYDPVSPMMDDADSLKSSRTQARVNGVIPNRYRAYNDQETMHIQSSVLFEECSKSSNAITQAAQKTPDNPSQGAVSSTDVAKTGDVEVELLSPAPLQDPSQNGYQTTIKQHSRRSFEKADLGNCLITEKITEKDINSTEVQILPYVLYEGGAYQLPVSLGLELKSKLQRSPGFGQGGQDLTERLAFMSTSQVQTLQNILRHKPGDQIRKLAHLEVIKKSSMKFWRKSEKVTIAFVEGEMSSMPEGVSLVIADPAGIRSEGVDLGLLQNTAFGVPPQRILSPSFSSRSKNNSKRELLDTERSSMGRIEPTKSLQMEHVRRQSAIAHTQSLTSTLVSPLNQLNDSSLTGLSGIQDVTPLLIMDEEWRNRFVEHYKVWTIRPFLGIDQTQGLNSVWDRCAITEKHLNIPEIRRRLTALDKSSMTVLEKMTMLAVSQQLQVQQSFEVAKSGASGSVYQWKLRQLDIVRSKRFFRPNYVKKVIVYAYMEPCAQAFDQPEELQNKSLEIEEGPSNVLCSNNAQPSLVEREVSSINDKTDDQNKSSRNMTSIDKEDTISIDSSEFSIKKCKNENDLREESSEMGEELRRRHRRPRVLRRREIERANEAIASRPPVPSESRGQSQPAFSRSSPADAETGSPRRLLSPQPASTKGQGAMPPIIINNHIYEVRRHSYSTDESDSSGSDIYKVKAKHPNVITSTGRVPTRGSVNNHQRADYYDDDESDAELREKAHPLRRDIQAERERTPRTSNRSTGGNSVLQCRRPSLSWDSYSVGPRQRSKSVATSRSRPRLLKYYTDEELRAKARAGQRYPDEFDKQPYNPQISPEEVAAGQEAIEQLLLEWTPLYKAEYDSDNHDEDPSKPTQHEISQGSLNEQSHSTFAVAEELEGLQYVTRPKDANRPAAENEVDIQLEKLPEGQAGEKPVAELTRRDKIEWTSRIAVGQLPFSTPQRRETTDGISLVKPVNRQASKVYNSQTLSGSDDNDIKPRLLQKGDRAATVPIPERQTWEDINWARQIIEETATLEDPDEYEPPLRTPSQNPITAEAIESELSPRGRGRRRESELLRDEWRRDIERHRSPRLRRETREISRADSFERRPNPPPRRRTVEFEGLTNRRTKSQGRHRDSIITVESRESVSASEPQERQQSQTQARYRSPHIETWVENND